MAAYLAPVLALVGWSVLPGVAIASVVARPRVSDGRLPERFTMVAIASGVTVWVLASRLIVRVGLLTAGPVIMGALVLGGASIAVMLGPGRATVRDLWSRAGLRFAAWAGGSMLVGALPVLRLVSERRDAFLSSTSWYYWSLVRQTVAAHGNPSHSLEWGTRVLFLDDYPGFTAATGVLSVVAGTSTLAAARVVMVVVLMTAAISLFILVRALGGTSAGAAVATVLFFAAEIFVQKLASFRPESFGYCLAFLIPALALEWLDRREWGVLAVLAASFAALGQVHGIDWMLGGAMLAGALVASVVGAGGLRSWVRRAGAMVGAVAGAWIVVSVGFGGGLSGAAKVGNLPTVADGVDPTFEFFAQIHTFPQTVAPDWVAFIRSALHTSLVGLGWPFLATLTVLAVGGLGWFAIWGAHGLVQRASRRTLLFLAVVAVVILAICSFFALGWETFVPRRTGFGRLFQLYPAVIAVAVGVSAGLAERQLRGRDWRIALAVPVVLIVALLAVLVHGRAPYDAIALQAPSRETLQSLQHLGLPPGAVVAANGYTEGFFEAFADGNGVIDGRAPYTDAELLDRSRTLIDRSRRFFGTPKAAGVTLPCRGVQYVLVAVDGAWHLTTPSYFPTDFDGLDRRKDLRLVRTGPGYRLYRVRRAPPSRARLLRCATPEAART